MLQSLDQLVQNAASGDQGSARQIRAAARLMSVLEGQPQRLPELFQGIPLENWPQPRLVLGITGAPGSGKSTLTDSLISEYRTQFPGSRLGVIAVDPSSPFTGGAVLGDRVRMMNHATDPMVFIRSLASRGHLGGLSLGVKGVLRVMGLIGCDTVFIETVGVGQSEVEVAGVADLVLVILAPGQGDSIQMLKAGLMEVGDIFVVNKADKEGAAHLHGTLLSALSLDHRAPSHAHSHDELDLLDAGHGAAWQPETELEDAVMARRRPETPGVFLVSAAEKTGIPELIKGLEERAGRSETRWRKQRDQAVLNEVREAVFEEARQRLQQMLNNQESGMESLHRVLSGEISVSDLTQEVLENIAKQD